MTKSLYKVEAGHLQEFIRFLDVAGVTKDIVEGVIKFEITLDELRELLLTPADARVSSFSSPFEQILNIRRWSKKFGWQISEAEYAKAEAVMPEQKPHSYVPGGFVFHVLVPYTSRNGYRQRFIDLLQVATSWHYNPNVFTETPWVPENLSDKPWVFSDNVTDAQELSWETINLWPVETSRYLVEDGFADRSPHLGIAAAMAHLPGWVKAMALPGHYVPSIFVPGLKIQKYPNRLVYLQLSCQGNHFYFDAHDGREIAFRSGHLKNYVIPRITA